MTIVTGGDDLREDSQAQLMFFTGQGNRPAGPDNRVILYQHPGDVMEFKSQANPSCGNNEGRLARRREKKSSKGLGTFFTSGYCGNYQGCSQLI